MLTKVKFCTCEHAYQDHLYGDHMRLMNWARNAFNKLGGWRCTVCDRLHNK